MPRTRGCASFACHDRFAVYSDDGTLHVWDCVTGEEKLHFTPTSHLAATFTCLSWKVREHKKQIQDGRKRKKLKSNHDSVTFENIALGTAVGDVLIFNSQSGEITAKLIDGHVSEVNDVCWNNDGSLLYSCSKDQHIIEWDTSSTIYKSKWKADKREVVSISLCPNSKTLLSAGRLIKLWDVKTKELLRKFSGHVSPVISLSFIVPSKNLVGEDATAMEAADGLYFISAALDERSLSAWQIKSSKHKKTSLCAFSLPAEPRETRVLPPKDKEDPIHILCLTQDEELVLFSHIMNGPMQKPLQPKTSIRLCTEDAEPLSIISASFHPSSTSNDVTILLAYGSTAKLVFERIKLSDHSTSEIVLIRKDPTRTYVSVEDDKLKMKVPIQRKNEVSSIVPGAADHVGGSSGRDSARKRKKFPSIGESQMTMEDRMNALSVDAMETADGKKSVPVCADSFSVLLSQGLQSNDRDVLNQVLQHGSDSLIKNTIQQLPLPYIIPLLRELTDRLHGSPDKCLIFVKWLRSTLSLHASYLMTFPDISPLLNDLYQLMSVRTQTHGRLSRLEGKLDLIMNQVVARKTEKLKEHTGDKALYVFEEESSDEQDEENLMDGMITDDLDDDWEEFSDDERKPSRKLAAAEAEEDLDDNFEVLMAEDG